MRLRRTPSERPLAKLPDAERDVITLAYFGELSASEIARGLSVPHGTVKGRMRLGLTRLRTTLPERPQAGTELVVPLPRRGSPGLLLGRASSRTRT